MYHFFKFLKHFNNHNFEDHNLRKKERKKTAVKCFDNKIW